MLKKSKSELGKFMELQGEVLEKLVGMKQMPMLNELMDMSSQPKNLFKIQIQ